METTLEKNDSMEEDLEENQSTVAGCMSIKEALELRGTTVEQFVSLGHLPTLLKKYKPSKLKQLKSGDPIWTETFCTPGPTDVVYPAVKGSRSMFGNALMTRIVRINLQYFNKLSKMEKRRSIDAIIGHFETIGTTFMEAPPQNQQTDGQTYRVLTLQGIITKVLYLFRIQTFRMRKKLKLSSAENDSKTNDDDTVSIKISSSMSSQESENKLDVANRKKPRKQETKGQDDKKAAGRKEKELTNVPPTQKPVLHLPSQSTIQDESELSDNNSFSTAMTDITDATDETKSKRLGKWYLGPLMMDLESRKMELERFVAGARLEILMQRGRRSRLSRLPPDDKIFKDNLSEYRSIDVVIPLPDGAHPHVGNALLNLVTSLNVSYFASLITGNEKRLAIDALISYFESLGSRFLEPSTLTNNSSKNRKVFRAMKYEALVDALSKGLGGMPDILLPNLSFSRKQASEGDASDRSEQESPRRVFDMLLNENLASRKYSILRFVSDTNLSDLMKTYRPSALKQCEKTWGKVFKSVRPLDFLLPRSAPRSHLGNALLNDVVYLNREFYSTLSELHDRQIAVDALVGAFEKLGTRFLERLPKESSEAASGEVTWRAMSYRTISEKITKMFRNYAPSRQIKATATSADEHDQAFFSKSVKSDVLSAKARKVLSPVNTFLQKYDITLDSFIEESKIENLLKTVHTSKLSRTKDIDSRFSLGMLRPVDVLLGNGGARHPGNGLMELVVRRNQEVVSQLKDKAQKEVAADALIAHFESYGARFLQAEKSGTVYASANYDAVLGRVMSGLCRSDTNAQPKAPVESAPTKDASHEADDTPIDTSRMLATMVKPFEKENLSVLRNARKTKYNSRTLPTASYPFSRGPIKKRVYSEVETLYQTTSLRSAKRAVLAPRPIFYSDE